MSNLDGLYSRFDLANMAQTSLFGSKVRVRQTLRLVAIPEHSNPDSENSPDHSLLIVFDHPSWVRHSFVTCQNIEFAYKLIHNINYFCETRVLQGKDRLNYYLIFFSVAPVSFLLIEKIKNKKKYRLNPVVALRLQKFYNSGLAAMICSNLNFLLSVESLHLNSHWHPEYASLYMKAILLLVIGSLFFALRGFRHAKELSRQKIFSDWQGILDIWTCAVIVVSIFEASANIFFMGIH